MVARFGLGTSFLSGAVTVTEVNRPKLGSVLCLTPKRNFTTKWKWHWNCVLRPFVPQGSKTSICFPAQRHTNASGFPCFRMSNRTTAPPPERCFVETPLTKHKMCESVFALGFDRQQRHFIPTKKNDFKRWNEVSKVPSGESSELAAGEQFTDHFTCSFTESNLSTSLQNWVKEIPQTSC